MTHSNHLRAALVAGAVLVTMPAYAAEGAATGNGTSTPAGPAADHSGPTMGSGASAGTGTGGAAASATTGATTSGTSENRPTATGGQPGGAANRN